MYSETMLVYKYANVSKWPLPRFSWQRKI